jgi:protocatechuate 3,4-dioxygenase beta subunit
MNRTEFLKKGFGSLVGMTAIIPIIDACKSSSIEPAIDPATGTATGSTNGSSASDCKVTPTETAGPFPTKIPANFVLKDIRTDRTGVQMIMNIAIKNGSNSCNALAGAVVDVWHCDKDGNYSEYGNVSTVHFLRGRQTTDASGNVGFTTVFPGWYSGRAPHIHVHVFSATGKSLLITQIAFPKTICDVVYGTATNFYTRGLQNTTNERDGIFSDGFTTQMPTVSGNIKDGYTLTHNIVVAG